MSAAAAQSGSARPHIVTIDQIVGMLSGRAEMLARELLPQGRRSGAEWVCGSLAGEPGTQMAVHLSGSKAGVWKDFRANVAGDALDLVAQVLFRGDKRQALVWSRRWLGLDDGDPAKLATMRRQAELRAEQSAEQSEAEAIRARNSAFAIWMRGSAGIRGTPVEHYLAGRGIDLSLLGKSPGAIRFHPELWCAERQGHLPAMVTAISGPDGLFAACHRTWLEQAGPGDWRKARLEAPKKVLGSFKGGMMRIWRGASGRPMTKAPDGEVVDVTEGIEDALSVATAMPECRVVAAISLSNLGNLRFPPQIRTLRVWRQADTAPAAVAAYQRAIETQIGRGMAILEPPLPDGIGDVNDLISMIGANT